jgi:hypothetical protein
MAIIIKDYEPSGDVVEVQFPGSKKRFEIPTSDVLTVDDMIALRTGDYQRIADLFDAEAQEHFLKLRKSQLEEFVQGWLGEAKN